PASSLASGPARQRRRDRPHPRSPDMNHLTSPAVRWTVALALALAGVTTVVSILLMPDFSGTHADWLAEIAADPSAAAVSAHLFAVSQLLVAVGVVGVAVQVFPRAP